MQDKDLLIHPTAIVHPNAQLGEGVSVGPFSIIEANVVIGARTKIGARVSIEGYTTIGEDNEVFSNAVLGSLTQDKKYKGGKTFLKIGDRNKIREFVTMNPGTDEGTETIVGSDNLIMAYAHIAHNCLIGSNVIIANAGTLAGHVIVEDRAVIGGLCGVHQFVRIGYMSIMGGSSKASQDVPPFVMVDGHPAKAFGLNTVGLERAEVSSEERLNLKRAFKVIFRSKLSTKNAIVKIKEELPSTPAISRVVTFLEASERGICK
jgi:UDP-N-acetylglucosamine acyltransferase